MLTLLLSLMAGYMLIVLVLLKGRLSSARGLDKCRKGLFCLSQATLSKKANEEFSILHGQFGTTKLKAPNMKHPRGSSNQPRYQDLHHFTRLYTSDKIESTSLRPDFDFNIDSKQSQHPQFSSLVGGHYQNSILTGPKDSYTYYPELLDGAYFRKGRSIPELANQHQYRQGSSALHTRHSHLKPTPVFGEVKHPTVSDSLDQQLKDKQLAQPRLSRGLWLRGRQRKQVTRSGPKTTLSIIFERSRDESEEHSTTRITTADHMSTSSKYLVDSAVKIC